MNGKEKTEAMMRNYRLCFSSPAGQEVLLDLMRFCHFRRPFADRDSMVSPNSVLLAEGHRQVFLHIMDNFALHLDQIVALYSGQRVTPEENEDAA
jgi:hypothetical protein